jgi:hypothetical protein
VYQDGVVIEALMFSSLYYSPFPFIFILRAEKNPIRIPPGPKILFSI